MLPAWNPASLNDRIPGVNIALIGGRRMGKSTATADLLWRNASRFDLVVCFVGSAHCNPVLEALLERYWDSRFFFSQWDEALIQNLLAQQEKLEQKRSILILVDDVILGSKAQEQLATLAMRGRHFGISLFMCCVSYTTLPKRVGRRARLLPAHDGRFKGVDLGVHHQRPDRVVCAQATPHTRVPGTRDADPLPKAGHLEGQILQSERR